MIVPRANHLEGFLSGKAVRLRGKNKVEKDKQDAFVDSGRWCSGSGFGWFVRLHHEMHRRRLKNHFKSLVRGNFRGTYGYIYRYICA
jgi:hypothetical protein